MQKTMKTAMMMQNNLNIIIVSFFNKLFVVAKLCNTGFYKISCFYSKVSNHENIVLNLSTISKRFLKLEARYIIMHIEKNSLAFTIKVHNRFTTAALEVKQTKKQSTLIKEIIDMFTFF